MRFMRHITAFLACFMFCVSGLAVPLRRNPGYHIPEYYLPTDRDNPALWESQPSYMFTRAAAPGAYATNSIPRTGTIEYPLVLVDFQDLHFITKDKDILRERYERMFNEQGYSDTSLYVLNGITYYGTYGSVSDYFRDQSNGQYIPKFKIIGPITLSMGYAYYGKGSRDNVKALVREVCDSIVINNLANLPGYARDGIIDQISIIYAGRGENYTGSDPNTIWPQVDDILFSSSDTVYKKGVRYAKYACTSELFWNSDSILDGIGTFCHEFSHTLGLPDFYNTSSDTYNVADAAMGYWSLMDYGCYEDGGFSPVGYTAFEKYSLGWLELEEITYPGTFSLNDISQLSDPDSGVHTAYRLSTGDDDQFIILEHHLKTGWYKYHKAEGLMVTAVDYNQSIWNSNKPNNNSKRYSILPADNNYHCESNYGDLFPYTWTDSLGTHTVDSITTRGKPLLKAGSSYPSLSIYNITRNQDMVTFQAGYDMPSSVENVKQQETTVTVYDISGKPVLKTTTSDPEHISLPGHGIWIIKYGDTVRKVSL